MEQFIKEIHNITNPFLLARIKNEIKDKITDSTLRWDERMILYQKVQVINQWILELRDAAETVLRK